MMNIASESWRPVVAGDKIVTANRDKIEGCRKAATKAREAVRVAPATAIDCVT